MTVSQVRFGIVALLAAIVATTPLAIDMYLPAMPIMVRDMATNAGLVQQSLSIYLAFYGLGMLIFGPLADALGRRPLALWGLAGFSVASIGLAFVQDIEHFLWLRAVQAFAGSAATVVVPGIIRHLYQQHTAKGMSYVSMIMMLAPLAAPALGSLIMVWASWPWIFAAQALFALLILSLAWRFLPEIKAQGSSSKIQFLTGYKIVLGRRSAQPDIATSMFASFAFFSFLTSVSFIYIDYFKVNEATFSVLFAVNVMSLMAANFVNSRLVSKYGAQHMLNIGLVVALLAVSTLTVVNWFGLGLWYTVVCIAPMMASLGLIATNADAMILMKFPDNSGTATAVIGTLRFGSGAIAGPLLAWFATGTPLTFCLLNLAGVFAIAASQWWRTQLPNEQSA